MINKIRVSAQAQARSRLPPACASGTGISPGAGIPATGKRLEDQWGAQCFDGYGSLEFQPIAWECEAQAGAHLVEDFAVAEVVDAATGEPVADGTRYRALVLHASAAERKRHETMGFFDGWGVATDQLEALAGTI